MSRATNAQRNSGLTLAIPPEEAISATNAAIPNQQTRQKRMNGFRYCRANSRNDIVRLPTEIPARPTILVYGYAMYATAFVFGAKVSAHIATFHSIAAVDEPDAQSLHRAPINVAF